jgi:hypothetical protein
MLIPAYLGSSRDPQLAAERLLSRLAFLLCQLLPCLGRLGLLEHALWGSGTCTGSAHHCRLTSRTSLCFMEDGERPRLLTCARALQGRCSHAQGGKSSGRSSGTCSPVSSRQACSKRCLVCRTRDRKYHF